MPPLPYVSSIQRVRASRKGRPLPLARTVSSDTHVYMSLRCEAGESDAELTRRINEDPEGFVTRELLGQAPSDVVLTVGAGHHLLHFPSLAPARVHLVVLHCRQ